MLEFTVLMAVYHGDCPILLKKAINSVYRNTIVPPEFVLVVDGPISSDLQFVIDQYVSYSGFKPVYKPVNSGLAKSLNEGLSHCSFEAVIRADADDINRDNRFELLLHYLKDGFDLVGSFVQEVDEAGNMLRVRRVPINNEEIVSYAKIRSPFNHMTVAFHKSTILKVGGYPDLFLKEDYGLWLKLLVHGCRCYNIPQITVDATAGTGLHRRRGGLKYVRSEYSLQKLIYQLGLNTLTGVLFVGCMRSIVFLLPVKLRGIFYDTFLRHKT